MPDYYAILWRALEKGDPANARWREGVFQQTRQTLLTQLRSGQPLTPAQIKLHTDALEAAIKAIQSEFAGNGARTSAGEPGPRPPTRPGGAPQAVSGSTTRPPFGSGQRTGQARSQVGSQVDSQLGSLANNPVIWVGLAVVVAAIAAGAYAFMASRSGNQTATASKIEASSDRQLPARPAAAQQAPQPKPQPVVAAGADGELPPGIDGGSTEADVAFFFRRQPVFYRTTHPVGTIIIDKQQHFLYLVQPNQVALRYGIGVGKPCADTAGLRKVANKVEWPQWEPPADMVDRKVASPGLMKGGAGNPLGARLIGLDDASTRIHGTNAPKTIGNALKSGCIRLVNDDVVDLYSRVPMGARVVLTD
jgi:lipoprotein-anchoring transpeptidase ErfK/SrfK